MLQNGISHRCACVKLSTKGWVSHHFGGVLASLKKVSSDMGYRSDSIAIWRDMGPLRRWGRESELGRPKNQAHNVSSTETAMVSPLPEKGVI